VTLGEQFADVFRELERDSGLFGADGEFTWAGATYLCVPNASRKGGRLEAGGFAVDSDLVLHCDTPQFSGNLPSRGQTIVHKSITYRISDTSDGLGGFIRLACVHDSRGA
jgi:hypothetical protein